MLRRIEAEAVDAAVDTRLEQVQRLCLNIPALRFQLWHTQIILGNGKTAVIIGTVLRNTVFTEVFWIFHIGCCTGVQVLIET